MKPGDLVKCNGACYSQPVNHHGPAEAIRYYDRLLPDGTLGVILDSTVLYYTEANHILAEGATWYQILAAGRTAWVNGSGVRPA